MLGERLIFVGGAPRSGTTLAQNILDSHPDICGGPEFDRIPDIVALREKLHKSISVGRIAIFCSYDDVDRAVCSFIENILLPFADRHGCKIVSEKTPWNVLVFDRLVRICPNARFIHVVRDPRAVVASMLEVGEKARKERIRTPAFTRSALAVVKIIKQCLNVGFSAKRHRPTEYTL